MLYLRNQDETLSVNNTTEINNLNHSTRHTLQLFKNLTLSSCQHHIQAVTQGPLCENSQGTSEIWKEYQPLGAGCSTSDSAVATLSTTVESKPVDQLPDCMNEGRPRQGNRLYATLLQEFVAIRFRLTIVPRLHKVYHVNRISQWPHRGVISRSLSVSSQSVLHTSESKL